MRSLFVLFFAAAVSAAPLQEMNQRLEKLSQANLACADDANLDSGLLVTVSCSFSCDGKTEVQKTHTADYRPEQLGLRPGNGSSAKHTVWSMLGVSLKSWSEVACLYEAQAQCAPKAPQNVKVAGLASGSWKIDHFPSCAEKSSVVSPFDQNSGAERLEPSVAKLLTHLAPAASGEHTYTVPVRDVKVPLASLKFETCQKKLTGELCFGDCVDLAQKEMVETLGTAEPLGQDTVELCGDDLAAALKDSSLSESAKQIVCEDYFWASLKAAKTMITSCAAIRGRVDCSAL